MNPTDIKIIGLSASPRANSNSRRLLDNILAGACSAGADCSIIDLSILNIKPCIHCDSCISDGLCPIADDMEQVYDAIENCHGLVVASPIYFMGLSAQLKLAVDRCQRYWAYRNATGSSVLSQASYKRRGIFVGVGARNTESVFAGALTSMRWFFDSIDTEFYRSLTAGNCDAAGEVDNKPEILAQAYELGVQLAKSYK